MGAREFSIVRPFLMRTPRNSLAVDASKEKTEERFEQHQIGTVKRGVKR